MRDLDAPSLETCESGDGASRGWVACLRRGTLEVWFAGGPGIGRIGYTLDNKDAADAAVAVETGKMLGNLASEREAELERVVEDGRLWDRAQVIPQEVEGASGFRTVSVSLDSRLMGHLVEQYENEEVWLDEKVSDLIQEAQKLARALSGLEDADPDGGLDL